MLNSMNATELEASQYSLFLFKIIMILEKRNKQRKRFTNINDFFPLKTNSSNKEYKIIFGVQIIWHGKKMQG